MSDGNGAIFSEYEAFQLSLKKAGTYSTTRSFYECKTSKMIICQFYVHK